MVNLRLIRPKTALFESFIANYLQIIFSFMIFKPILDAYFATGI